VPRGHIAFDVHDLDLRLDAVAAARQAEHR
jgi:hypothetical protein